MGRCLVPGASDTFEQRFWAKVAKGDENSCWVWQAATVEGYGVIGLGGRGSGTIRAHRSSVLLDGRTIPGEKLVRHLCNNRACVNPKHLEVGTYQENAEDSREAGTLALGYRLPQTRLTTDQVIAIKVLLQSGALAQWRIAALFGIHQMTVSDIATGTTWQHVSVPFETEATTGPSWADV